MNTNSTIKLIIIIFTLGSLFIIGFGVILDKIHDRIVRGKKS